MESIFIGAFFDELEKLAGGRVDRMIPRKSEVATKGIRGAINKILGLGSSYHPGEVSYRRAKRSAQEKSVLRGTQGDRMEKARASAEREKAIAGATG